MSHRALWALSLFWLLLPACGQQLVEFRNPGSGTSDASITADGKRPELILETATPGDQDRDAPGAASATLDAMVADPISRDTDSGQGNSGVPRVVDLSITGVSADFETQVTHFQRNVP